MLSGGGGHDIFVAGAATGDDRITDFEKKDLIDLTAVAGVDDFSDLAIVTDGANVVISWGTDASMTLENFHAGHLDADNFAFAAGDSSELSFASSSARAARAELDFYF